MRILFYSHAPELGGAERSLLSVLVHSRRAGHEILLCAPSGSLAQAARQHGLAVRQMPPFEIGYTRNPARLLRYAMRAVGPIHSLVLAIRRFAPDLLHANTSRSGLVAAQATRFVYPRPALVVHARDALNHGRSDWMVSSVIGSQADVIIAISHFVAECLAIDRTRVRVLHNAIDQQEYQRDIPKGERLRHRLGIRIGVPLLAVAGQITPWKGQLEAISAFALVRQQHPEAHLLLAGAVKFTGNHRRYDNRDYHLQLVARGKEPDVAGHVHLSGEIADANAIYSAADALLVPSWEEPFGRVVIEAMAARCPVIATAAGGIPEIIEHGVEGLLVPSRNPAALGQAALALLRDPTMAALLIEHGRRRVAGRFTMGAYMLQLQAIWTAVLSSGAIPFPSEPPRRWTAGRDAALRLPPKSDVG